MNFFENFKLTQMSPNNFFQMMYELTKYNSTEEVQTMSQLIRPGLFDNMN